MVSEIVIVLTQEQGENFMSQRTLLKPEQEIVEEPAQRKKFFKMKCKVQGKCCNLIIDGGNTKNLVSTQVMEKLKLKCLEHT